MLYYFVKVPRLPPDTSHQSRSVRLVEYKLAEGQAVEPGGVIAVVENWWARMALTAVGAGVLSKTFFERGTDVAEGDPIAIVICDGENAPRGAVNCELVILQQLRARPAHWPTGT